jgi:hypothetical protein
LENNKKNGLCIPEQTPCDIAVKVVPEPDSFNKEIRILSTICDSSESKTLVETYPETYKDFEFYALGYWKNSQTDSLTAFTLLFAVYVLGVIVIVIVIGKSINSKSKNCNSSKKLALILILI